MTLSRFATLSVSLTLESITIAGSVLLVSLAPRPGHGRTAVTSLRSRCGSCCSNHMNDYYSLNVGTCADPVSNSSVFNRDLYGTNGDGTSGPQYHLLNPKHCWVQNMTGNCQRLFSAGKNRLLWSSKNHALGHRSGGPGRALSEGHGRLLVRRRHLHKLHDPAHF